MVERVSARVELSDGLWNKDAALFYGGDVKASQAALLEQYKTYVEMADRISQRRSLANTFFLSLNTAIFVLMGSLWKTPRGGRAWLLLFPLIALLGQCLAWFYILRSYGLLNSAKYAVIGALEERLPASPYWKAEWIALGEGRDFAQYWPLTHIEEWIPILFAITYLAGFLAVITI